MQKKFTLFLFGLFCFKTPSANIINVPNDYATIQDAILNSSEGDTVLVEPGIYYENINFRGHNVVLTSRYYEDLDTTYISSTVIDGSQPVDSDTASCIILNSEETSDCVIQGFTIRGGAGTVWYDIHGAGIYREGGAILTEFADPVIQFNILRDNQVTDDAGIDGTGGGAIRCGDSNPTIQNNVIIYNEAAGYGGGIVLNYSTAKIRNNIIAYNTGGTQYGGGGIWCTGSSNNTVVHVENNSIAYNTATGTGTYAGKGGGIFVFSIKVNSLNNIIWGNDQSSGGPVYVSFGGTVAATYSDITGGYSGTGNIDLDPQFMNCFYLSPSSLCIDAGDISSAYNDPGTGNSATFPSMGTLRNDMGAFGGALSTDLPCINLATSIENQETFLKYPLITNYPNPFSTGTTISFSLHELSEIQVEVVELNGTPLFTLLNDDLSPGSYSIYFCNGRNFPELPGGAYLLTLKTGDFTQVRKLIVAKQ